MLFKAKVENPKPWRGLASKSTRRSPWPPGDSAFAPKQNRSAADCRAFRQPRQGWAEINDVFTLLLPLDRSPLKKSEICPICHQSGRGRDFKGFAIMPRLTCVTTTYNDGATALTAINSVLAQSFEDFQYIVVDDGSTDDTVAVLQSVRDPRLQVLRQANDGLSSARNRALQHVKGDYVCFLDSDDVRPNWSFAAINEVIQKGEPDVILSRGILSEVRGDMTGFYDEFAFHQIEGACPTGIVRRADADFARLRPLMQRIEPQSANKAVRMEFLRRIGLQFPNGHFFEDIFFHTGLLSAAASVGFAFSPCFTYFRRYMRQQITATSGERRFDSIAVTKLTLENFSRTLEFRDAVVRTSVLISCLRIVAWCETTVSHQNRYAFHQTVKAALAGLDPLYLNIPPNLPAEAGNIDEVRHYLEAMRHAA